MTTGTTPTPVTVERLRELKPCPFCGERAEALTHSGQGPITYYVTCMYCCAEFSGGADMQSAIEGWNRRTVPDVRLPQGVKRIDDRRLDEIVSGYTEFPEPDCFEIRSLGYEVRNWRMRSPAVKQATACGDTEGLAEHELRNIAEAKRFDRDKFDDDSNFADWAQSRARFTLAALTPLTTPQGKDAWLPIESAPRDGTEILGWREDCGQLLICYTHCAAFMSEDESEHSGLDEETMFKDDWFGATLFGGMERLEGREIPTHWQPLPDAPSSCTGEGKT